MRTFNPFSPRFAAVLLCFAFALAFVFGHPAPRADAGECDSTIRRWTEGGPGPITVCVQANGYHLRLWSDVDQSLPDTGGYTHYWHRSGAPVCLFTTDRVGQHVGGGRSLETDAREDGARYAASIAPGYFTWAQSAPVHGNEVSACNKLGIEPCWGVCGDWVTPEWMENPK